MPNHFPLVGSGSGVYALNVASELVRTGHEVLVIVPDHRPVSGYEFPVETILFRGGNNKDYGLDFNFPCFTTHPRSSTTFYELSEAQIVAYVDAWRAALGQAAQRFRPDIVHVHHVWVAGHVARGTGIPYVATCHGTELVGFERGARYREMALNCAGGAHALIAISRHVQADAVRTYGVHEDGVRLIWNGFDDELFRVIPNANKPTVLRELGIKPGERPLVAVVGKFTEFKGIDVLLQAATIYEEELPGVQTVLAGDGALWDEMHALRDRLGLEGICFVGHRSQSEIARLFNAADLAVVPSRAEAFGLVAIEALACGTPVVATDAGGIPDFINGDVGRLVPPEDPAALAAAILDELRSESKGTKGSYASRYAAESFSWARQVTKMTALYEEALECSPASGKSGRQKR